MKKNLLILLLIPLCFPARSQETTSYYLPQGLAYNSSIPAPSQFFGHEVGEWHLTHDKLYFYMLELAKISDRAVWEEYGRSYENRPLGQLIISSPENIKNIEQIRQQHLLLCDPSKSVNADISGMPVIIKLGYGVHGNESSAQNASAIVAYYLTAGEGARIDELLSNAVILIDPALNPDGMQRHSTWVNSMRSLNNNPDPASIEFDEPWPGGRTNHYWFDLNRDYLLLQHPESKGRVAAFHRWKPNINTDHHETGAGETFFFQPGIKSRNNPLTPAENYMLTAEIGNYHRRYLDSIGSMYFTEEDYDDFYIGKGSSYPDIHGSVGILFEQAGVKGHLRETPGGMLKFPFAIRNQVTVSLSTLEAGLKMKDKLLESQRNFYREALTLADRYPVKAYVFTEPDDMGRLSEFINILIQHRIRVFTTARDISHDGIEYKSGSSYIVPLKQTEYRFVRSLFEPVKEFTDSIFYDISTWVMPMAFNIHYSGITQSKEMDGLAGPEITKAPVSSGRLVSPENPYAFLFEWNEYYAPKALYALQSAGVITRVSTEKFTCDDGQLKKAFGYGTIVIPASGQLLPATEIKDLMAKIAGNGVNSSDAGEIWHLLDARFKMPVTMINPTSIGSIDLDRYNVLIINGSPEINSQGIENIRGWNRRGGTIIGYESGNSWISKNNLATIEYVPAARGRKGDGIYINRSADTQAREIPGSIFETILDLSHPLCYGFTTNRLPVFKSTTTAARKDSNIYNNPVRYTDNPLLSGYCTKANIERIKNSPFASVHGRGIISIYDDPDFRAIWYGTNKIFLNAIFFRQIIR